MCTFKVCFFLCVCTHKHIIKKLQKHKTWQATVRLNNHAAYVLLPEALHQQHLINYQINTNICQGDTNMTTDESIHQLVLTLIKTCHVIRKGKAKLPVIFCILFCVSARCVYICTEKVCAIMDNWLLLKI